MKIKLICLMWMMAGAAAGCRPEDPAAPAPPPPQVKVVQTAAQKVPLHLEFVGQVLGAKDIAIRARVEGFLEETHFQEGSEVIQGDLLYVLESQPYEAEVAAMMSRVAEAKTMLVKAQNDLNRIRPLAQRRAVSQSDLDAAIASQEAAVASVEAAQANLRAAKIQLGYTKIYSPITGIIGQTESQVGDFVGRSLGTVVLNTVSQIDSIRVQFFLTEEQYLQLARRYATETEAKPQEDITLILADGSRFAHTGRFDFIDRQVDPATGAIRVQTSFPNPERLLRPGQFAKIRAVAEVVENGILIPQRCLTELQGEYSVYVVTPDGGVEERPVRVGPAIENFRLIREGLKPGEQVVYEGLQKIRADGKVTPVSEAIQLPAFSEI